MWMPPTAGGDLEEEGEESSVLDLLNLGHLWDIKVELSVIRHAEVGCRGKFSLHRGLNEVALGHHAD